MAAVLLFIVLLSGCKADVDDLSGKVFSFPEESDTSHVKLSANTQTPISAMTLCLRFFSEQHRGQSLFSLATPSHDNNLLLFKPHQLGKYRVHVEGADLDFFGLPDDKNGWNSVCWTWQSGSGLTQLWVNGKRSVRAFLRANLSITGKPSVILGQEQDTYGGGFHMKQSFVGDITDVHLWDRVLSPCEIRLYIEGKSFAPGNVLNWRALEYASEGNVFVEMSDFHSVICKN
ncbi:C-reactive protein-like [Centroberyx gerrardi]|uniref:C-reactive protein-like n=1 Tax=Centroberyx gerrardi TaxID=166262 RepID=UPI003AADCFBE